MTKIIDSGELNGRNFLVKWCLKEDGTLIIKGEGPMPDFFCGKDKIVAPWNTYQEDIIRISVGEGITTIGVRAFEGSEHLQQVKLPSTLERINAYAFKDCVSLKKIVTKERNIEYVYVFDKKQKDGGQQQIQFGIGAFSNVPWALEKWGEFYKNAGVLHICFSDREQVTIPEDIHTINTFAFKSNSMVTCVNVPYLSLGRINAYAFVDSRVESVCFPARRKQITINGITTNLTKIPGIYHLQAVSDDNFGEYKRLKILRREPELKEDGTVVEPVYMVDRNRINIGRSISEFLQEGNVLIGVRWYNHRIMHVVSYIWKKDEELYKEYEMQPCKEEDGSLGIATDFSMYWRKNIMFSEFSDYNVKKLLKENCLRFTSEEIHEEWFLSSDRKNYGGPLEIGLVELFRKNK